MTTRKQPRHKYENRLWKGAYAWSSFQHVRNVCDYILSKPIQFEDAIYYPLITAICVVYARPFKPSKGIESLTVQFVPKKFRHLHDQLILLRDQTVAHVDARSAPFKGLPANNVRLIVSHGQVRLGVNELRFTVATISDVRKLANALVERMHEYSNKLGREYPHGVPDDGEYLIDLTTGTFRRL